MSNKPKRYILAADYAVTQKIAEEQLEAVAYRKTLRCPCMKKIWPTTSYRCLYCDVYFCKPCAELHFGQTVAEYREQNPIVEVLPSEPD